MRHDEMPLALLNALNIYMTTWRHEDSWITQIVTPLHLPPNPTCDGPLCLPMHCIYLTFRVHTNHLSHPYHRILSTFVSFGAEWIHWVMSSITSSCHSLQVMGAHILRCILPKGCPEARHSLTHYMILGHPIFYLNKPNVHLVNIFFSWGKGVSCASSKGTYPRYVRTSICFDG